MAKKFKLQIACDNIAFLHNPRREIVRILRQVALRIESDCPIDTHRNLHDVNGQVVGTFVLQEEKTNG